MGFKDQAAADLDVFFSVDEFAETHNVNGAAVACILDAPTRELPGNRGQAQWEGVGEELFTLHGKADELPAVALDQRITVDDRPAQVIGQAVNQGVRVIRARWWQS